MMSFRATVVYCLTFSLLGCSHTVHYNYPPPHPPGTVLDLSSIQEPVAPKEQPPADVSRTQISPPIKDQTPETQSADTSVQEEPVPETPVNDRVPDGKSRHSEVDGTVNQQVQYWIDRLSGRDRKTFQSQLARLDKIRPDMERIFQQHGIPKELVYLCLVESGANPHAVSCSGATGYWQFIPDTAKKFGLQVNRYVDERKHLEKSTRAAALYLKHLHAIFGDWNLSIAAYNAGEGAVMRLMKGNGVKTFWDIDSSMAIKSETIAYVPKYMATVIIAQNRASYGLPPSLSPKSGTPDTVDDPGYLGSVARADASIRRSFAQTDPEIVSDAVPVSIKDSRNRNHRGAGEDGSSSPDDSSRHLTHTVKKGDTLYSLARKHGSTVAAIARANHMSPKKDLVVGKTIVIPVSTDAGSAKTGRKSTGAHTVAKGETLKEISKEHAVPVEDIISANHLKDPDQLQPEMTLVIPPAPPTTAREHASAKPTRYTVKKGDTLWGISRQFDVSAMDLMRWNKLTSTAQIRPGDKLTINPQ